MKKIFQIIILLMFIWKVPCEAAVFYDDYQLIEEGSSNYYEETDTLKREETIIYNNYYYEQGDSGYYLEGDNPESLPYIDYDDYQMEETTLNPLIELGKSYGFLSVSDNIQFRYFILTNFDGQNEQLEYLNIYLANEKIDYQITDQNFSFGDILDQESYIIIDLGELYYLHEFRLELGMISENENTSLADFKTFIDNPANNNSSKAIYLYKHGTSTNHVFHFLTPDSFNSFYHELTSPDNYPLGSSYYYFKPIQYKYLYYNLNKITTDIYTTEPLPNHNHDSEDFKLSYSYYERNKIEINDVITNNQEDIIISSSIPFENLFINHNINLEQNGEYFIEIYYNNELFCNHTLIVDIPKLEIEPITPIPEPETTDEIEGEEINADDKNTNNTEEDSIKDIIPSDVKSTEFETVSIIEEESFVNLDSKSADAIDSLAYNPQNISVDSNSSLNSNVNSNKVFNYHYLIWGLPIMLSFMLIKLKKKN